MYGLNESKNSIRKDRSICIIPNNLYGSLNFHMTFCSPWHSLRIMKEKCFLRLSFHFPSHFALIQIAGNEIFIFIWHNVSNGSVLTLSNAVFSYAYSVSILFPVCSYSHIANIIAIRNINFVAKFNSSLSFFAAPNDRKA